MSETTKTYLPHFIMQTVESDDRERIEGYTFIGDVKHYCCYGMYAEVGHTSDCKHSARRVAFDVAAKRLAEGSKS